ncbi:MAG: hypothetical protein ABGZ53_05535 [Fuerstiella sp.]
MLDWNETLSMAERAWQDNRSVFHDEHGGTAVQPIPWIATMPLQELHANPGLRRRALTRGHDRRISP